MQKVYVASNRNDAELEKVIYNMDAYFLRIALYGIARGDNFDDAVLLAEHAAQQSVQADLLLPCGHNAITSYLYMLGVCSVCNSEANR